MIGRIRYVSLKNRNTPTLNKSSIIREKKILIYTLQRNPHAKGKDENINIDIPFVRSHKPTFRQEIISSSISVMKLYEISNK